MQEWLINLSVNHFILVYMFIVVFACIEGPILSMAFGVLIKLNYFSFIPVYIALMLGDLLGDTCWYYIGYFSGYKFIRRFGKYFNVSESLVEKVKETFHKHKHKILFISKTTNIFGFGVTTLLTAGIVKIPYRNYIIVNLIGQFFWSGFLIGMGYFLGNSYVVVEKFFHNSTLAILCVFALGLIFLWCYRKINIILQK